MTATTVRSRIASSFAALAILGLKRPLAKPPSKPSAPASASPKARAAQPADDDSDDELHGRTIEAEARLRERARCRAIVAAGAHCSQLAQHLAFRTLMPRQEAVALLAGVGTQQPPQRVVRHASLRGAPGPAVSVSMDSAFITANPANAKLLAED